MVDTIDIVFGYHMTKVNITEKKTKNEIDRYEQI